MKKVLSILMVAVLVFGLTACKESKEVTRIKGDFLAEANEVEITETSVTFKDASERDSITIDKNPKKVAILYASYTNLWYETGGVAQGIIGGKSSITSYKANIGRDICEDEGVTVLATSSAGSKWNVEEIIAFQPDLIVASTAMSGYATIKEAAHVASIPVIAVEYNNFQDYLKWFKVFSAVNGNEQNFEDVALNTLSEVSSVIEKIEGLEPVKVAPIKFYSSKTQKIMLSGTYFGAMLNDLGAVNVGESWDNQDDSTSLKYNLEQVIAANPDQIIIYGTAADIQDTKDGVAATYEGSIWEKIPAVENGNLYFVEKGLYHYRANKDYGVAYKKLAQILYPDVKFDE